MKITGEQGRFLLFFLVKMSTSYLRRSTSQQHLTMTSTCSVPEVLQYQLRYRCSTFALAPGGARRKYPTCCKKSKPDQRPKAPLKRKKSCETQPEAEAPIPHSAIPHDDLPVASILPRTPHPPISSPSQPLTIHNLSVDDYQRIYHQIEKDKLRFKNSRVGAYRLMEGRRIKQMLWERLGRPMFTTTEEADGRLRIATSCGAGVRPPQYDVDITREPKPPKSSLR
ncbi:uncharacterized protein LOC144039651 isoform X2 [Vanacampus margaritifer]